MKTKIIKIFSFTLLIILTGGYLLTNSKNISQLEGSKIGDTAPEINLNKPDSTTLSLNSLKGNYIILDFWASWCGPCRRENPNKVKTYNTYKDKTFKGDKKLVMYSVSLDKDYNSWVTAIQKDNLYWENHVSDLKFWQSVAARTYNVNSIPANFLINDMGVIIGKNLRGEAMDSKLEELLQE